MQDESKEIEEDGAVDRLVRESGNLQSDPGANFDEEALVAYVLGRAAPGDTEAVRSALLRSKSLRAQVTELAADLDSAIAPGLEEEMAKVRMPAIPELPREVFRLEREDRRATVTSLSERLGEFFRAPRMTLGLAAAIAAFIAVPLWLRSRTDLAGLPAVAINTIPISGDESFGRGGHRGPQDAAVAPTAQAAAIDALRRCVESDPSGVRVLPSGTVEAQGRRVQVHFVAANGHEVGKADARVPREVNAGVDGWIVFPSMSSEGRVPIQQFAVQGKRIRFAWDPAMGNEGCLVLSHPVHGGFAAGAPVTFRVHSR